MSSAESNSEKGSSMETLLNYLLDGVPGLEVVDRDVNTALEELDLVIWNQRLHPCFRPWGEIFLVECKNWATPVGAEDVAWFANKLRERHLPNGIFVARNGITGDFYHAAGKIVMNALREGIRIVVLTGADLGQVTSNRAFTELIKTKYCGLYVGRPV
jgi:hypothetical protein